MSVPRKQELTGNHFKRNQRSQPDKETWVWHAGNSGVVCEHVVF
jgi:hypothetical protein